MIMLKRIKMRIMTILLLLKSTLTKVTIVKTGTGKIAL